MIGTKLAHYEITTHIGSGGMGDVYQANDTKLGRNVAIKFLPEAFGHDTERVARFQREARILASLNHTNIAAIYGVEGTNSRHFLVMELVAGETLADRIKRGAIPIEEALPIAQQIAEALEAAHEQGIVHRDLKPANIKITPDGKVKVLDFGLAKAMEPTPATTLSNSPTLLSAAASNAGVILGTAAYMSPEQAKGKAVDKRADIWAFGVVVYEMLTGRMLFSGESASEMMAAVMMKEPDWNALPANTPARLRELVRRCLIKEPRRRLQAIGDARIVLEEALSGSELNHQVLPVATRGQQRIAWLLVGLLALTAVMLGVRAFRPVPAVPSPPETRVDIVTPVTNDPISFALSPDGRQIVFVASEDGQQRLWLRPLDKTTAQPLAGTEGASYPFWSPDSRSVGFFTGTNLKRIDLAGGSPQTLANTSMGGGTWSESGIILFSLSNSNSLYRVPASGGETVVVTKLEKGQTSHRFPEFLPGGRQFLFAAGGGSEPPGIYLGSLDAPETKRLTAADSAGVYAPQGWLLFIRAGTLLAQRLNLTRRELTGDPVTVADPVVFGGAFVGSRAVSVSAAGMVAYRAGGARRTQLGWFDRSGKPLGTLGTPDENRLSNPRLSPDGRRVAVQRTVQGNTDVWILDGDRATRFTFDAKNDVVPIWSPDGSKIVFASFRKGPEDLYQKPSSGAGSEELLLESAQNKIPLDWSPDGRFIIYLSITPQTQQDLWVLPLEGDRKPFVFLKTSFGERRSTFSPDGHWMAYISNESGRDEIYVRPFPGPGGQWQVSTAGGTSPRWAPSGKELYYVAPDGMMMAAPIVVNGAAIEPGRPAALFHTHILGGGSDTSLGTQYDVTHDGRFLINTVLEDTSFSSPITLVQNWHPSAK